MKINDIDIAEYNAKQFNFSFEHASTANSSDWAKGAVMPYLAKATHGFMTFEVRLDVKGKNREEIRANCSEILALLNEPVTLQLDGFENLFRAVMTSHKEEERSLKRYHMLTISFQGYEYSEPVIKKGITKVMTFNPGNIISPGIVTLTASEAVETVTLAGICMDRNKGTDLPAVVKNLTAGSSIVIDGVNGLVTENGSPREVEMWTLPSFKPGTNIITCSNDKVTVKTEILPLYM